MAVIENDVVMKFKDSSGNVNLLYPITRANNVDGLQEAIRNQSVVTKGTGAVYTATVEGIASLSAGVSFVMIPHTVSTTSSPKLNVNGLGEKLIKRRVSNCTGTFYNASAPSDWLTAGKPITMTYDGEYWVADLPVPNANDIMGAVHIANGGTGATTATQARINLGIETTDGTVSSGNANYAEVGEWVDGNPDAEDRIGYFVCVDNTTAKMTMRKATEIDDVRGVTITAPAFSGNCSNDKFDSDGNLIAKYSFVAVMGNASVIDNGTCTVNGRCMPTNDGTAIPSPNSMGYQVISRIDATHVLIMVEPQADMLVRIKNDVTQKADLPKTVSGTVIALSDASSGPLQGLRVYGRTTQDGTPTPDNPVELVSAGGGGSVGVTVAGKNLVTSIQNGNIAGAYNRALYAKVDILLPDTDYFISFVGASGHKCYSNENAFISTVHTDFTCTGRRQGILLHTLKNISKDKATCYDPQNGWIIFKNNAGNTVVPSFTDVQIEAGTVMTDYEAPVPYQTIPISTPNGLPGIPVTSGGNYTDADGQQWICDEVDFARGVYVQRVATKVFDGSESGWKLSEGSVNTIKWPVFSGGWATCFAQSSHFQYGANNAYDNIIGFFAVDAVGNIYFATGHTTLDDFKLWIAENPVTVVCRMATPIETPIPEDELAAYAALHTNRPNTTVYNDAGAHMEVGYYPPDATMRQEDIMGALDHVGNAAREYVDSKRFLATVSLPAASWAGDAAPYTQTVPVSGILATDFPHITPVYSSTLATALAQKEAWSMVNQGVPGAGEITFTCFEDKPATAIPIQIEVMR